MAGFQAGLTGGTHTLRGAPESFWAVLLGDTRRGFIIPENQDTSTHCDNDYILISEWLMCFRTWFDDEFIATPKEAKECVTKPYFGGYYLDVIIEVDGQSVDLISTAAKLGVGSRSGRKYAFSNVGHIFEPFSFLPGDHTATAIFTVDEDGDGIADFDDFYTAEFTIIESATAP